MGWGFSLPSLPHPTTLSEVKTYAFNHSNKKLSYNTFTAQCCSQNAIGICYFKSEKTASQLKDSISLPPSLPPSPSPPQFQPESLEFKITRDFKISGKENLRTENYVYSNLVPRVLRLFGQRLVARRVSPVDQPLAKEPEDSWYEIAVYSETSPGDRTVTSITSLLRL